MSELKESEQNWRKAAYIGFVCTIALSLMVVNLSMGAGSPIGFPTVIEPGSNVGTADYVLFKDGSTYYAKNGTTGAISFSGISFYTIINDAIDALSGSGLIFMRLGTYALSSDLVIETSGIRIEGTASSGSKFATPTTLTTNIVGNVIIRAENVKLAHLNVYGDVEMGATVSGDNAAHWVTLSEVYIYGQYRFVGKIDVAQEVPFSIIFENGGIQPTATSGPAILFDNTGGCINHIFFLNSFIDNHYAGDVIRVITSSPNDGSVEEVRFTNVDFMMYHTALTIVNCTGNNSVAGWHFDGCDFEIGNAGVIFMDVANSINEYRLDFTVSDSRFRGSQLAAVVYDRTNAERAIHSIRFLSCDFYSQPDMKFYAYTIPTVLISFTECILRYGVTITALNSEQVGIANFINCQNLNPVGVRTMFHNGDGMSISLNPHSPNYPYASTYYTIYDVGVWVTSTGGDTINITIKDPAGNAVISNVQTLSRTYLPLGYSISWGALTGVPTVMFEGE